MKTRVNISFWARKNKGVAERQPDTRVTIMCRIAVGGKKGPAEISTGLVTTYGNWMPAADMGHVKGRTPADKHINTQLTKLRDELTDIWADLERQKKPVTARAILRLYKNDGCTLSLLELMEAFIEERAGLVGLEISQASHNLIKWRQTTLTEFLEAKKLTDLRPEEFTHNLADKFSHWALQEKGHGRTYVNKMLSVFNQLLRWGVRRELFDKNPMELYKYKPAAPKEIKYLTVGELRALTAADMPAPSFERARDCFVFQCWTGLAYADLKALDMRSAEYRLDGQGVMRRLLRVTRQKSTIGHGYECVIPLLPEAERILAKYNDALPVVANALYNLQLKRVGATCGLAADKMTTHVGRKTAGVMMLNLGIRMETVSKFLGHSSVKMTEKIYAKILDSTVTDEFDRVFSAPPVALEAPAPPPLRVLELPAPTPAPAAQEYPRDTRWLRPAPVTSHGKKGGATP